MFMTVSTGQRGRKVVYFHWLGRAMAFPGIGQQSGILTGPVHSFLDLVDDHID